MSMLEVVAVALGLACVWLTVHQHIGCWPTGLAMVLLYIFIFYDAKLYSDMLLQVVYVFLQLYGWYAWLHGGQLGGALPVTRIPAWQALPWLAASAVGTLALGSTMSRYTDASFPFLDAFTTVASLIAQWLMGRKRLESWAVWIVVDVVSIGLYLSKQLYMTAGLYAVFLILAVMGFWKWNKAIRGLASA